MTWKNKLTGKDILNNNKKNVVLDLNMVKYV